MNTWREHRAELQSRHARATIARGNVSKDSELSTMKTQSVSLSRAPESNEARVAAREATAAINAEREAHSKQLLPEGQRVAEFEAVIAAAEFVRDLPGDPTAAANGGRRPFLQPGNHSLPDQGKDHAIRRDQR